MQTKNRSIVKDDSGVTQTSASIVYERLRDDILSGALRASVKLRIDKLRERYGVGPIPLREALNRLLTEGLVTLEDRKGFCVPAVSLDELRQLTQTRCWLNEIVVRESLAAGDKRWEERVILAAHYLRHTPRAPDSEFRMINREWEWRHRDFHIALIEGCPSRWFQDFHATLFDYADRYRHQYLYARAQVGERDVSEEHDRMQTLALARDSRGLIDLYNRHIEQTTNIIIKSVDGPGVRSDRKSRPRTKK
jgi:GntR family transcriptional regulator, carbon starvation induced regulator